MQKLKYMKKDILDALLIKDEIDVLVQGCNCFCSFGRGLAEQILERVPEALDADKKTTVGDKKKLGSYTYCEVNGKVVVNAYTQYHFIARRNNEPKVKGGRGYVLADYRAIRKALLQISKDFEGKQIGIHLIGAGWANGDWIVIEKIIKEAFKDSDLTIYYIPKDEAKLKELGCI
ncbi:hypothetical protein B9J93_03460 [Vibrio sp. V17_P4S1T151]|uniref:phosphatase n=1 Tax=unclassified Vibrio TaxID=2614977 RepID=UPI000B9F2915|nr:MULTISPECIES: phosphatase [unclassified Vibrio]OXX48964.1 hypothetical protein B9J93_03460 [Vibrio sp. V17_P4S1T151]OXX64842.1 hypothetical protein B9J89_02920 [Vibrio sp. V15_P4S5T153]